MTEPTTPAPKAPSVWSKPGRASLILISLVVVAAAALAIGSVGNDDTAPAEPGEPTTAASEASPDASASAVDDAEGALNAAPDVEWKPEDGGILLPYSSHHHGPTVVADDGVANGFARTSAGALLAAVHIALRSSAPFDDAVQTAVITAQIAPGPDRETLLAGVGANEANETASAADLAVVCAYRLHSWSEDEAVVELVLDAGEGQYVSFLFTLSWTGTDWQMAAPPGGTWASVVRQVSSLDGFLIWGP